MRRKDPGILVEGKEEGMTIKRTTTTIPDPKGVIGTPVFQDSQDAEASSSAPASPWFSSCMCIGSMSNTLIEITFPPDLPMRPEVPRASLFCEIDKNIDYMSNLRRDKRVVEGKLHNGGRKAAIDLDLKPLPRSDVSHYSSATSSLAPWGGATRNPDAAVGLPSASVATEGQSRKSISSGRSAWCNLSHADRIAESIEIESLAEKRLTLPQIYGGWSRAGPS
ncbi:Forkhead Box Protein O1 [Manis pentadactyla]|nr:Forkhead Box Protein O1 [Manis pentadactyla]